MTLITQNTNTTVRVFITAIDHITGITGATLTVQLAKASGGFGVISPVVTEVGFGWYDIALTSTHTNTLGNLSLHITALGADTVDVGYYVTDYADQTNAVWDEPAIDHTNFGTTGLLLSQIAADTSSIQISQTALTSLVNTVLKYERNRTRIDTTAATLTIYDDDCTTPLTVFNLKDHLGNPSVAEVCDRSPVGCP